MTGFIPVPPEPWVPTATDSESKLFPSDTMDALDERNDGRYATTAQGAKADAAAPASTVYDKTASDARFATAAQGERADSAYQKPGTGVPKTDLASAVQTSLEKADAAAPASTVYDKTASDARFATAAQGERADSAYQKPGTGVPKTDLASAVQTSLGKADTALQPADVGTMAAENAADYLTATETNAAIANGAEARVDAIGVRDQQRISTRNSLALRHARLALGGRASGPFDMWHIGDSITDPYYATLIANGWPRKLLGLMRAKYPTDGVEGGVGFVSARRKYRYTGDHTDNVLSVSGGSQAGEPAFGLDLQARVLSGAGQTLTLTFTGTGLDIDYTKFSGGGTFSWAVDGGAATNVSTVGATLDPGSGGVQIRSLAAGSHTVVIAWVSGTVYFNGAFVYNGDEAAGIRQTVLAKPGRPSGEFWPANSAQRYWTSAVTRRSPDMVTICFGPNDYGGLNRVSAETFKSNISAIIAAIKAALSYVPSFVLIPVWQIDPQPTITPLSTWAEFVNAVYEVAEEDADASVAVMDWQQRINPGLPSTAGGFLPDKSHPGDAGNDALAHMLIDFIAAA